MQIENRKEGEGMPEYFFPNFLILILTNSGWFLLEKDNL